MTGSQDVMWLFIRLVSWYYRTNVYVTGVMSLQPTCYGSGVIVQVVQNHSICDRCYATPSCDVLGLLLEPRLR